MTDELDPKAVLEKAAEADPVIEVEPSFTEDEQRAMKWGWKPKTKWVDDGGDPDSWRSAKDHLERGEMIGKIRSTSQEIDQLKSALQHVSDQNKKIFSSGYQKAISDLKAAKRQALEDGDLVRADEIGEKIEDTKKELEKAVSTPAPKVNRPDPEHLDWVQENPWYENPVMQKFADALAIEYIRVNNGQVSPAQVRSFVSQEVRQTFPHKFEDGAKKVTGAPNPDGGGRSGANTNTKTTLNSNLAKAKAGMSEDERQIMKTLMRSASMTEEEYLKMYVQG